jgi:hypothetical protein
MAVLIRTPRAQRPLQGAAHEVAAVARGQAHARPLCQTWQPRPAVFCPGFILGWQRAVMLFRLLLTRAELRHCSVPDGLQVSAGM